MGYSITLHLFDDTVFYKSVVPTLGGETGSFKLEYLDFMKSHITGGILHLSEGQKDVLLAKSVQNVIDFAICFDTAFKRHNQYNIIDNYDKRRQFLNEHAGYYDFIKFFEYYVFKTCADFFPHIPLRNSGLWPKLKIKPDSLIASCIAEMEDWDTIFCADAMGIISWANAEAIELLYYDQDKLQSDNEDFLNTFRTMIDVAYRNKLGMIIGVDMRENILEQLPCYKLVSKDTWDTLKISGLIFKR